MSNVQTLAESFLADLDELSDDDELEEEEEEEAAQDDDDEQVSQNRPLLTCMCLEPACMNSMRGHAHVVLSCRWTTLRPSIMTIWKPWRSSAGLIDTRISFRCER